MITETIRAAARQQDQCIPPTAVIRPTEGWAPLRLRELWEYRDLVYFLAWRDIKSRYAQSVLGIGWAIIQPLLSMLVFTIIFGRLARMPSDGAPYALFSYVALIPWTYFASALTDGSTSLVSASAMIKKVYFPRLIIPLTPVLGKLLDLIVSLVFLTGLMLYFGARPTAWIALIPALILLVMTSALGLALVLASLSVRYRDVNYALGFGVQLFMYATPVVYPASVIPERFQLVYALNPLVGPIEGFRSAILGTRSMPWDLLLVSASTAVACLVLGAFFFRRTERAIADVI